jgi:NADH-quinone oxidoreductase subunit G
MPVTYRDVERAAAILVVGLDAEHELPILHLRIRKAAARGARVVVVHPRRTRLWDVAEEILCMPGDEAAVIDQLAGEPEPGSPLSAAARALADAGERAVILSGPRMADSPGAVIAAAGLAAAVGGRFAHLCRRAGDRGALRAGVHPGLLPGGRSVVDPNERAEVQAVWGQTIPTGPGRDTGAILQAAADRRIDVLFLVGVDVRRDFPDAALAERALQNVRHKVVVDLAVHDMGPYADAVLPACAAIEKDAHLTDWEGRTQRILPVRAPLGLSRPDWQIFGELSRSMGRDIGLHTLEELQDEMARLPGVGTATGVAGAGGTGPVAARTPTKATDALTMFTYPSLVDEGRQASGATALKEALEEPAFVQVNTVDAERLGLSDGELAVLSTAAGRANLPVRVTGHIAPGAVFIPWNNPGLAANTLLDGSTITPATLSPAGAPTDTPVEVGAS